MKKGYFLIAVTVITAVFSIYLTQHLINLKTEVQAQISICPTELSHSGHRWIKNDFVRVRIHSAFTNDERQIILSAFAE